MRHHPARVAGAALLALAAIAAAAAPALAPNPPDARFPDHVHAPPTRPRLWHDGAPHRPFIYPWRLVNRLERRYGATRACRSPSNG